MEATINEDILFNILLNSTIDDIKILYQTTKTFNHYCNNDFFW